MLFTRFSGASMGAGLALVCVMWIAMPPSAQVQAGQGQGQAAVDEDPPAPIQVFFVRHAEKKTDDPKDPDLSEDGIRRAAELARVLRRAGVTHLFASEYRRTRDTLAPLAEALQLEVVVVPAGNPREQAASLQSLPAGSVAVVAGHSNTVPGLIIALGAKVERMLQTVRGPMMKEDEYSRLFLVSLPPDEARGSFAIRCMEMTYGDS